MNIIRILPNLMVLIILVAVHGCAGSKYGSNGDGVMSRIYKVTDIKLTRLQSNPPQLQIMAKGKVTSSGWTKPQLQPFTYIKPPTDGIYDLDFVAVPASGITLTVISDVKTRYIMTPVPNNLKGVRVHSKSNNKVVLLGGVR